MSHLNETRIPWNNSGLNTVQNTYTDPKMEFGGYVDCIRLVITTASGIANGGSLWVGESGTASMLLLTSLTGTTMHEVYPRRAVEDSSGTAYTGASGLNSLERYVIPSDAVAYIGGSAIGSAASPYNVGGYVSIYWHKP